MQTSAYIPEPTVDSNVVTVPRPSQAMIQLLYRELRRLAQRSFYQLAVGSPTVQPTVLVHEAYLRLAKQSGKVWQSRRHFYNAAALAMRHILCDRIKSAMASKHGGGWQRTELTVNLAGSKDAMSIPPADLIALDRVLTKLHRIHPDLAELVHLRFFCDLTIEEISRLLGRSMRSIERRWTIARTWLRRELEGVLVRGERGSEG